MKNSDTPDGFLARVDWRYSTPAIVFHWTLAILIPATLGLGWFMMSIEDEPAGPTYFNLHKSVGIIVFALVLARLGWRLMHRPQALPGQPGWRTRAPQAVHGFLYGCMIAMPACGLAGALLGKKPLAFFGMVLPRVVTPDHDLAEKFFNLHGILAWVLAGLIVVHVAAGLKHRLVDKDGVFRRMWFR